MSNVCVFINYYFFALGNLQCTYQSCSTRNLTLTENGPSVMLPCDFNTPINSSSTTAGNYTYCHDATILVTHSISYYTLGSINYTLDNSEICCFDNELQSCAVCYNLGVHCECNILCCVGMMSNQFAVKPRGRAFRSRTNTEPVFGDQYTVECEVIANPLPICEWRRQTFPSII